MSYISGAQIIGDLYTCIHKYLQKYNIDVSTWQNPFDSINVDNDYEKPFYGLIVSSSIINGIKHNLNAKKNILRDCSINPDVILEYTHFGPYVSGLIPIKKSGQFDNDAQDNVLIDDSQIGNSLPVPIGVNESLFSEEHELMNNLSILWDNETLGIYSYEFHTNDEAALKVFLGVARKVGKKVSYF